MSDTTRDNIRKLSRLTGLSQDKFGEIAGVTRGAVSQYETGFSEPRMGVIQAYSDYFGIPKSWIIERGGMDGVTRTVTGEFQKDVAVEPIELSEDERNILALLRKCPSDVVDATKTLLEEIAGD